eukprot:TRINITY_DN14251_c0_g1_i1.p1 TRINITY_DN14251_c0_g1~~TRINITY_DN14251_c0_g1_i1.p1  ORF type:complete len:447 (+),score=149.96 TRINITY_DN14251_c0_g1_i1:347-1687(+)
MAMLSRRTFPTPLLFCVLFGAIVAATAFSIDDFGAVAGDSSTEAALVNTAAITKAIIAANSTDADRTVVVPGGKTYYFMPVNATYLRDVTIQLDGHLVLPANISAVPVVGGWRSTMFNFSRCTGFALRGAGSIDGNGFEWWVQTFENSLKYNRPNMIWFEQSRNLEFDGFFLSNSPQYHIYLHDVDNVTVRNVRIHVDTTAQRELQQKYGYWVDGLPIFPLNTDGIDPAGTNILIQNITVENYDDVVAVKPINQQGVIATCSENITVDGAVVRRGVGMTIGSVPPHERVNCVRNVTFRNVVFTEPFKAVYVKTNPGDDGTGLVENILYENLQIHDSIWWTIYIGPQQQEQPDGSGPGCMFYPIDPNCPTQPRVTVRNITLRNVTVHNSLLFPGILRCNETNPCTGIDFDGVTFADWVVEPSQDYICENVQGQATASNPVPSCLFSQ